MTSFLRDAHLDPPAAPGAAAVITQVNADGTVVVDLGGGRLVPDTIVISPYTPRLGATVEVLNRDDTHWVVLGERRTSSPSPQPIAAEWLVAYDVRAAVTAANPLVVSAVSTGSWRDVDGWAGVSMPATDTVGQGAYTTVGGYYRGCYFYGDDAFASLAGKTCTQLRIYVHRLGSGGYTTATPQVIGPHVHGSQPDGEPLFPWGAVDVGGLAWNGTATFDCPPAWGDLLITGQAKGFGHLLLATGNGSHSFTAGKTADTDTGKITLDWA